MSGVRFNVSQTNAGQVVQDDYSELDHHPGKFLYSGFTVFFARFRLRVFPSYTWVLSKGGSAYDTVLGDVSDSNCQDWWLGRCCLLSGTLFRCQEAGKGFTRRWSSCL